MTCLFRFVLLFIFFISSYSFAASETKKSPEILAKAGNIYYLQNQITNSGKDQSPVLSSDKKLIAFVRTTTQSVPNGCEDAESSHLFGEQIWVYDTEQKKERLLVENNFSCDKPEKKIIAPIHLQFSPDNKTLYFLTSAWVTSNALHAVNVDDAKERFIIPANSLEVIQSGQYKGDVLVQQHRYFIGGGSFDWYWLFTPEGKEVGPLGDKISKDQRESMMSDKS